MGDETFARTVTRRQVLSLGGGLGLALAVPGVTLTRAQRALAAELATRPLRVGVSGDPASFDFDYIAFNLVGLMVNKNTYPNAIDFGVRGLHGAQIADPDHVVKRYAESWTPSADGKTWTLKLKKGLKFPSGNPVTAADIKWSKDRGFAAKANVVGVYRLVGLTKPSDVELVDDYTLRFHQNGSALSTQLHLLADFFFDSKLVKQHATKDDPWAKDWVAKNPQSGGAYVIKNYTPGQSLVMSANPNWPGAQPAIKDVILQIIPSAANMRLQLERGDVDLALGLGLRDAQQLKKAKGVKIITGPGSEYWTVTMSATTPPFDKRQVRQAMAYAVPYEAIIKNVFYGQARRSNSFVPLDMSGNSPVGYPYKQNLGQAKNLLAKAGVKGGFDSELVIEANDPDQQQVAILVASEMKKVGINLKISQLDPAALSQRRTKNDIPLQVTRGQMSVNDFEYLLAVTLTKGAFLNYANYINPTIEKIYAKLHTTPGAAARNRLAHEAQAVLARDVPMLMLGQPNFTVPVRSNIAGWVQPIDGLGARFYYLKEA
jgi:peptide/nickel transport system substrate-binding protein